MPNCQKCGADADVRHHYCIKCGAALHFSNYSHFNKFDWISATPTYTDDNLIIYGHYVMESWEKPYMIALARIATRNGGRVLELGFGMGISASFVQEAATPEWIGEKVIEHVVVEANLGVYEKLKQFAEENKTVKPVFGFWQEELIKFEDSSFDGILFDTYPLSEDEAWPEDKEKYPYFKEAHRLLKPGGLFTYYSSAANKLPEDQITKLREVGFENIEQEICPVNPPEGCVYWEADNFVCPIVKKNII